MYYIEFVTSIYIVIYSAKILTITPKSTAPHSIFTAPHLYRACNYHLVKVPYDFGDLAEKAKGGHVVNTNHRRV